MAVQVYECTIGASERDGMNNFRISLILAAAVLIGTSLCSGQSSPAGSKAAPSTTAAAKKSKSPAGNYGCVVVGPSEYFDVGGFELKSDGTYTSYKGPPGRYSYIPSSRAIKFSGGHYAQPGTTATYYGKGPVKGGVPKRTDPVIVLRPPKGKKDSSGHNDVQYCYLQAGPVQQQKPPANLPKSH